MNTTPPPYSKLVSEYEKIGGSQRLGQFFLNTYMASEKNPQLYYSATNRAALELIKPYYVDYQWPM